MAAYSDQLAARVRKALDERGISPRDVAKLSGGKISHMTVSEMLRGTAPSPRKIAVFALAIGDHPDRYLEDAGEPFRDCGRMELAGVKRPQPTASRPRVALGV